MAPCPEWVNGDVGCDAADLAKVGGCIVSLIGNRDDSECQSGSMSKVEAVSVLVCVGAMKMQVPNSRESCGRRALLELPLDMLQGTVVVDGKLNPIFQVLEETGSL